MTLRRTARFILYVTALVCGGLVAHFNAATTAEPSERSGSGTLHLPSLFEPDHVRAAESLDLLTPTRESATLEAPARSKSAAYGGGRIIAGGTPHRLIFFTFDDGPDRRTTPLLLDRLDAVGVKAAFFLTAGRIAGHNAMEREQANLAREIQARGHLIGSHTVDHLQLPLLDDAAANAQLIGAEEIFERVLGFRPTLLRPPGGARSPRIDQLLAQRGYTTVVWNIGAGDVRVKSANEVFELFRRVLDRRERDNGDRGGVVLLHDTYAWSVDAFQLIWAELGRRNCRLLERGEELYDIVPDLDFFYQARGDASASVLADPAQPSAQVLAERQKRLRSETRQRCSATDF